MQRGETRSSGFSRQGRQLTLDLPVRASHAREDFLVGEANQAALAVIDDWPDWSHWAVVLTGPEGSGKTHLAQVWRQRSRAVEVQADRLGEDTIEAFSAAGALLVESLERGVGDERVLFHLLNLAREHHRTVLLTTRQPPGELSIALPDLRSRLRALPSIELRQPDDRLLRAVLVKLFSDRQLAVEPVVIEAIVGRMERSLAAANRIVAAIDERALATHRRVTRPLALEVLGHRAFDGD